MVQLTVQKALDLVQVVGMLVAQDQLSGRLYCSRLVAVHSGNSGRPRPGIGVISVLEGADALRCATKECLSRGCGT
jgi:hypothetical protein